MLQVCLCRLLIEALRVVLLIYPNHNTKLPLSKHEKVLSEDEIICFPLSSD